MTTGTPMPMEPNAREDDVALRTCVACGYDLRGYDDAGRCPECGGNVGASKRERQRRERAFGPSMRLRGEPWLLRAGIGFVLFVIGTLMWVAVSGHGRRNAGGEYVTVVWVLLLATDLVLWLGGWLVSAPPRVEVRHARWLRLGFRALVTVWLAAHGGFMVGHIVDPDGTFDRQHLPVVWRWAAAVASVIGFGYLANVAARLEFFSVRRSCIALSVASLMLVFAAAQKSWIDGTPHIAGIGLPLPLHPMLGSIDMHLDLSRLVLRPGYWPLLWRSSLIGVAWLVSSLSTLTWFALALLLEASKYRRTSPSGSASGEFSEEHRR